MNQSPPLAGHDVYGSDAALVAAVEAFGPVDQQPLAELGARAGDPGVLELGRLANEHPPVLRTHDRYGERIDEVEFHPAWHELLATATSYGLHSSPWSGGTHLGRAAAFFVWSQVEAGHGCPVSMTYASVPALRTTPALAAEWEPRITARSYDGRLRPGKASALVGMAMTERQGGSDVRTNTTRAERDGDVWRVDGAKWFCSAPMSDAFLVLAQTGAGLSCFLLPRLLPDGTRNGFRIQRLKDKLGNRSNASSEVEFHDALAHLVGEEGRGVRTIVEMVNGTRLDCVVGSAAGMRAGVAHATHHAAHRSAFGRLLADQPLMRNVLADLAVESEAATVLAMRLAAAADREEEAEFKRLATAVGKYWVCKRAAAHAADSLECLGGNGFVEESGLPRLFRESPLNSIWEGSGNVNCLDVLRVVRKEPDAVEAFLAEVGAARGADPRFDAVAAALPGELESADEPGARRLVERMALALQGSLLLRYADPAVADAFCASRLAGERHGAYGTLPPGLALAPIADRARPKVP